MFAPDGPDPKINCPRCGYKWKTETGLASRKYSGYTIVEQIDDNTWKIQCQSCGHIRNANG